jgi:hypothetical protein
MSHVDRQPIYGPIQSKFDRARYMPFTASERLGLEEVHDHAVLMRIHLGTDITTSGRLLSAFRILRDSLDRRSKGESVPSAEVRQTLIDNGHLGSEWFRWDTHMLVLGRGYMLDKEAIDRSLDFEAAKQEQL